MCTCSRHVTELYVFKAALVCTSAALTAALEYSQFTPPGGTGVEALEAQNLVRLDCNTVHLTLSEPQRTVMLT